MRHQKVGWLKQLSVSECWLIVCTWNCLENFTRTPNILELRLLTPQLIEARHPREFRLRRKVGACEIQRPEITIEGLLIIIYTNFMICQDAVVPLRTAFSAISLIRLS